MNFLLSQFALFLQVFFSSFGDASSIANLGRTFFRGPILQEAFKMLSNNKEDRWTQYILLDDHPLTPFPENCRVRSNIFDLIAPDFFLTEYKFHLGYGFIL